MLSRIIKIIIIIALIGVIGWGGLCVYANTRGFDEGQDFKPRLPAAEQAAFVVTFKNRTALLTDNYDKTGESRYILHGYWELVKDKYVYRDIDLPLDERTFGKITVRKRN